MVKKATRFRFTDDQLKKIQSYFPEFEQQVEKHDPKYEGRNAKITAWKQEKAAELLCERLFQNLDAAETQEAWQNAVIRVYTNYFNASIKKGKPTVPKKPAGANNRGLVLFTGKISPKALFAMERHEEITTLYKSICLEKGIPGGPAKSEATTQLWEQEDQALWEEKARDFANNIDANRGEFTDTIQDTLQDMLDTGSLGSSVISLSYAFRTSEDNSIITGCVQASMDEMSGLPVTAVSGDEFDPGEDYMKRWVDYARQKLPRKILKLATTMTRNSDGLPLFPVFNLKTRSYAEASQILEDYFLALWEYTQEGSMRIPWTNIAAHPDTYYNTWDHALPCRLASPQDMDALQVTSLMFYLAENAVKNPFTFFTKARVEENLLLLKRFEDAPPPASPTQSHDDEVTPPASPLVKAVGDDDNPSDNDASDNDTGDDDATRTSLPLTKAVEDDNARVSPARSPSPGPPAEAALQPLPALPSEEPMEVSVISRSPSPGPPAEAVPQHLPAIPSEEPTDASALAPLINVPARPVLDTASVLSAIAQLFPGNNPASENLLAALTAMVANSGSGIVPPQIEPSATSEAHSAASSNVEEVGKKRKRGRPAKISQDVTSASTSTPGNLGSEPASSTRRTGSRQRKPVTKGPMLVADPSAPPAKKAKPGFSYLPVVE